MEVLVTRTSLDQDQPSKSRAPGVKCLLFEARKSLKNQQADEAKLLEELKEINPKMALAQILTRRSQSTPLLKQSLGKVHRDLMAAINYLLLKITLKCFVTFQLSPE